MVGVAFFVQAFALGNQYTTTLFITYFREALGASYAAILFCTTGISTLMTGLGLPLFGLALQRYSIRAVMVCTLLAVAAGYLGLAYAGGLWQIAALYATCFSVGVAAGNVASNTLVCNWFAKRRGLALAIAAAGISVAGFVIPPLANAAIAALGFSRTCLIIAALVACLIPWVLWLVVERPEGVETRLAPASVGRDMARTLLRELVSSRLFWRLALTLGSFTATVTALLMNTMPLSEQAGIDREAAALLISVAAAMAIVGKVAHGGLFARLGQKGLLYAIAIYILGACALLLSAAPFPARLLANGLVGLAVGACIVAPGILVGENFPRQVFSVAFGGMSCVFTGMTVSCLYFFGWVVDTFGSYRYALVAAMVVNAAVLAVTRYRALPERPQWKWLAG